MNIRSKTLLQIKTLPKRTTGRLSRPITLRGAAASSTGVLRALEGGAEGALTGKA